jgi:hypothetical protein
MSFRGMAHRMAAGSGATVPGLESGAKLGKRNSGLRAMPTDEQIAEVMKLRNIGMSLTTIAEDLHMGRTKVEQCVSLHEMKRRNISR